MDSGWQFKVFDRGDKVEKIRKSRLETLVSILGFRPLLIFRPFKLKNKLEWILDEREKGMIKVEEGFFPNYLIPEMDLKDNGILQEKVDMAEDVMEASDVERQREIIDEYIDFTKECWRHGFSESSFNFTINHGYDDKGKMVLVDIGEINYSKSEVEKQIKAEKWLEQSIYLDLLPDGVRDYFKQRLNEEFTLEELNKNWNRRKRN